MEKQKHPSSSTQPKQSNSKLKINQKLTSIIKDKNCPICLTLITPQKRPSIITNCMHTYCFSCLIRWSNYKRTCPLCNSLFHSFFFTSKPFLFSFQKYHLPPLRPQSPSSRPTYVPIHRFWFQRSREENRSRRRRSFGPHGEIREQRILQWRASIYKEGLQAVPFPEKNQHILGFPGNRESVLEKIEPWTQRELRAILQDPDPTIIVHVATSLYLKNMEKRAEASSTSVNNEDVFFEPLRRFLYEHTDSFWHELRCFAESPYVMHTYDEVVEYRK